MERKIVVCSRPHSSSISKKYTRYPLLVGGLWRHSIKPAARALVPCGNFLTSSLGTTPSSRSASRYGRSGCLWTLRPSTSHSILSLAVSVSGRCPTLLLSRTAHQLAGCSVGISSCLTRRRFFGRAAPSPRSRDLSDPPARESRNPPLIRFSNASFSTAVLP